MLRPFHLSIVVSDLNEAKDFYLNMLECKLGKDAGSWVNVMFFGHQLTIHQENKEMKAQAIDHFGPILEKESWQSFANKIHLSKYSFVSLPNILNEGENNESGKFLLNDPAGNLLEFKYYKNFTQTVKN